MNALLPVHAASIAVVIPCLNQSVGIAGVVKSFQNVLPQADIYVFDKISEDATAVRAEAAGARVRIVSPRGNGNVFIRMFADVEADIYLMVDGDGTYDISTAPAMVQQLLDEGLDMVVGCRIMQTTDIHWANRVPVNPMFNRFVGVLFSRHCRDTFSSYRVFSRRFVKTFPARPSSLKTETGLTLHAFELMMPVGYKDIPYMGRQGDSAGKLNTYIGGLRILQEMILLFRLACPFLFFLIIGCLFGLASTGLAMPLVQTYIETGLVPRLPTAILATGLALSGALSVFFGLALDSLAQVRREAIMLMYMAIPWTTVQAQDKSRVRK